MDETNTSNNNNDSPTNIDMNHGYTPLSDLNLDDSNGAGHSYVMVATDPRSDSDGASFYVNPDAFGTSNDWDSSSSPARVNDYDFDAIATNALTSLDEEYQQTLASSTVATDQERQSDEDLKIIAAGFDDQAEELQRIREKGGFYVNWEEPQHRMPSSNAPNNDRPKPSIDVEKVRQAINTLSVKNKDAPFQQKFAKWQQKQSFASSPVPHALIPKSSWKLFYESTPTAKSRLATADLSRSATLAEALERLSLVSSLQDSALQIDIVGVDHVECKSVSTIRRTFRPFVNWLESYFHALPKGDRKPHVHFRLIGRELSTPTDVDGGIIDLIDFSATSLSSLQATATCHSGVVYHEMLENTNETGAQATDLVVAFNAGIWGYREWSETIQYLARQHSGLPMVITAYTLDECQEDQEVISNAIASSDHCYAEILWESERNPFGSQVVRETKGSSHEYRENACWQAWLLGGNALRSS